jgi:hypothetical protein
MRTLFNHLKAVCVLIDCLFLRRRGGPIREEKRTYRQWERVDPRRDIAIGLN